MDSPADEVRRLSLLHLAENPFHMSLFVCCSVCFCSYQEISCASPKDVFFHVVVLVVFSL